MYGMFLKRVKMNKGEINDFKYCKECGEYKKTTLFHKHRITKDRLYPACKSCKNKRSSFNYFNNPLKDTRNSWNSMKSRCSNPNDPDYYLYGERGISFCDRWKSFDLFVEDMGERPNGKTLDRIDTEKGYIADNCRWSDSKEQQRNRRDNVYYRYRNKKYILTDLSEISGINRATLYHRINNMGMTVKSAVENPIKKSKSRGKSGSRQS